MKDWLWGRSFFCLVMRVFINYHRVTEKQSTVEAFARLQKQLNNPLMCCGSALKLKPNRGDAEGAEVWVGFVGLNQTTEFTEGTENL